MGLKISQKYQDGRRNNGGARKGAGRPPGPMQLLAEKQFTQEVVVREFRHGQTRRVKKPLILAILDQLRTQALKHGDITAINAYLDITTGKPRFMNSKKKPKPCLKTLSKYANLPTYYKPPKF